MGPAESGVERLSATVPSTTVARLDPDSAEWMAALAAAGTAPSGQRFWRRPGVRMDAEDWDRLPASFGFDPAQEAELGSSRNAIYKTMFDTRRKLRAALVANGYLHDDPDRSRRP